MLEEVIISALEKSTITSQSALSFTSLVMISSSVPIFGSAGKSTVRIPCDE
jgi:hypothetical protein